MSEETESITPLTLKEAAKIIDESSSINILKQPYRYKSRTGGEDGSINIRYRLCLLVRRKSINDEEPPILRAIIDAIGIPASISKIHVVAKDLAKEQGLPSSYELLWMSGAAYQVLSLVLPHLNEKKPEAELAIKFWTEGGYTSNLPPGPMSAENYAKYWPVRHRLFAELKALRQELKKAKRSSSLGHFDVNF